MAIVMTKDNQVRPMELSDLKEVAERDRRIEQLEKLNSQLAAEIDRCRPVITAVVGYRDCDQYGWDKSAARMVLIETIAAYESSGGKDGGR